MKATLTILAGLIGLASIATVSAFDTPTPFLEDFSTNPFTTTVDFQNTENASALSVLESGASIDISSATSTDDPSRRIVTTNVGDNITEISSQFRYRSESTEQDDGDSRIRLVIEMIALADNGALAAGDQIDFNYSIRLNSNNTIDTVLCARSRTPEGVETEIVTETTEGGGDGCAAVGWMFDFDVEHTVVMGVNIDSNTVYFDYNGTRNEYPILVPLDQVAPAFSQMQIVGNGESTRTRIDLLSINGQTDLAYLAETSAFSNGPADYATRPGSSLAVENGKLLIASDNTSEGSATRTNLRLAQPSELIEADLSLQSSSSITSDGSSSGGVSVAGAFYNDIQDGGSNDSEGDHWASVGIAVLTDGSTVAEACLLRSDTADYSEITFISLGNSDTDCEPFAVVPVRDTEYNARIGFNRATNTITLGFADEELSYTVNGNVFDPADGLKSVRAVARGNAAVNGTADNIRNTVSSAAADASGGGSGCSIGAQQTRTDPLLFLLSIMALGIVVMNTVRTKEKG